MMTRKDYVATAEILAGYKIAMIDEYWWQDLVNDFADFFASDNPNFNKNKFINACNSYPEVRA